MRTRKVWIPTPAVESCSCTLRYLVCSAGSSPGCFGVQSISMSRSRRWRCAERVSQGQAAASRMTMRRSSILCARCRCRCSSTRSCTACGKRNWKRVCDWGSGEEGGEGQYLFVLDLSGALSPRTLNAWWKTSPDIGTSTQFVTRGVVAEIAGSCGDDDRGVARARGRGRSDDAHLRARAGCCAVGDCGATEQEERWVVVRWTARI